MSAAGKVAYYTYDAEGHRIGKHYEDILYFIPEGGISYTTVRFPVDTKYFYLGDTLSHATVEGYRYINDNEIEVNMDMRFTYDAVGPLSVNYNGTEYFYLKNAQGDVTGIVNAAGTQVVAYTYDAWGKLLSTTGSMAGTLGEYNPLRYRGYVYDTETGLYYLNSRYYNPETGRFINADSQLNDDMLGNNMFAYCSNNPVVREDDGGQGWWTVAGAIIGGVISAAIQISTNIAQGEKWNTGVLGAMAGGALYGAIIASTGNVAAAAFASSALESVVNEASAYVPLLGKLNNTAQKEVTKENIVSSVETVVFNTVVDGTIATATGVIAGKIIPTGDTWIKPQKFTTSFTGKYAVKSDLQSIFQAELNMAMKLYKKFCALGSSSKQQQTVSIFPVGGANVMK